MILDSRTPTTLLLFWQDDVRTCSMDLFNEPCAARVSMTWVSPMQSDIQGHVCMSCRIKTFSIVCQLRRDLSMPALGIGPDFLRDIKDTLPALRHMSHLSPGIIYNDTIRRYCISLIFRTFSLTCNSLSTGEVDLISSRLHLS
jgi:hypothetical protein